VILTQVVAAAADRNPATAHHPRATYRLLGNCDNRNRSAMPNGPVFGIVERCETER
jgi:hypothetical protein